MQVVQRHQSLRRCPQWGTGRPAAMPLKLRPDFRRAGSCHSFMAASFPRIIEDLPLRRHRWQPPVPQQAVDWSTGLMQLFHMKDGASPELLITCSVLFALILLACAVDLTQRTLQALATFGATPEGAEAKAEDDLLREIEDMFKQPQRSLSAKQQRSQERILARQLLNYERLRGLQWLAVVTAIAVWSTGILAKDNPLQP